MSDVSTTGRVFSEANSGLSRAEDVAMLSRMLNNLSGENGITVQNDWEQGIRIFLDPYYPESMWAFGVDMIADNQIRVYSGRVILAGKIVADVAQTDVTLTSSVEYVYVHYDKVSQPLSGSILKTASYPVPTSQDVKRCLCEVTADGSAYGITRRFYRGDIYLDTPLTK